MGQWGAAQTDRSRQASICCWLHGYLEDSLKQEGKGRASCEVTPTLPAAPHLLPTRLLSPPWSPQFLCPLSPSPQCHHRIFLPVRTVPEQCTLTAGAPFGHSALLPTPLPALKGYATPLLLLAAMALAGQCYAGRHGHCEAAQISDGAKHVY